jgi:phosphoglycolate phosphatase
VIVGGEDVSAQKPDPTGLLLATDKLGGAAGETIYVGDSPIDVQTALAANIPFIAVISGVSSQETFEGYKVLHILKDLSELPRVLGN